MNRIGTGKLRLENTRKIMKQLQFGRPMTKRQIAESTSLTVATVGTILTVLLDSQLLIEADKISQEKSRPTIAYLINTNSFNFLNMILFRKNGANYYSLQVNNAFQETIFAIEAPISLINLEQISHILEKYILDYPLIKEIIIGIPSIISQDRVIESDISELKGMNLKEGLEKTFDLPIFVKNDMNFCALGYALTLPSKTNISYLTLPKDSGPGCGSIIDGQLLEGTHQIAGEIIYLPFFNYLRDGYVNYSDDKIAKTIVSLASIVNPERIVFTGDDMNSIDFDNVLLACEAYLPNQFIPKIIKKEDYFEDYFQGMKHFAVSSYWENYFK